MSKEHETQKEIRRILRLLETTARIIEGAAITESPQGSEERCARQFNNALNRLTELGAIPADLFEPIETHADLSDIGFVCQQVTAYVRDGCADDFDFAHMKKTVGDELKDFGETVRQSMPDFFKDFWGERTQEKSKADTVETVEIISDEEEEVVSSTSVEQRIARLEVQMETVVDILQEIRTQQVRQNEEL